MSTAGSGVITLACLCAVVGAAAFSVQPILEGRLSWRTAPRAGWVLWLVVALPSLLQIPYPGLYEVWHRSVSAVRDGHQWWRVVTALVVQDGGIVGTIFNLILLAVALSFSLPLWGARATVLAFLLTGVGLNVTAVLAGAEDGAGNSGATVPLLATLPLLSLAVPHEHRWRAALGAGVTGAAGIVLVVAGDGHGIAVLLGLLLGFVGLPYARWRARTGLVPTTAGPPSPRA